MDLWDGAKVQAIVSGNIRVRFNQTLSLGWSVPGKRNKYQWGKSFYDIQMLINNNFTDYEIEAFKGAYLTDMKGKGNIKPYCYIGLRSLLNCQKEHIYRCNNRV